MRQRSHVTTVTALVLRASAWGEKDRLLVLVTRERGRVVALAQGAQRLTNRLAPVAQTGVIATMWLAQGREFERLTDYRILGLPRRLRQDVVALTAFCLVAECLELATPTGVTEHGLFDEVIWFWERLEAGAPAVKWLVVAQVRLLWHFGLMPHLIRCALCGADLEQDAVVFAPYVGGALCENCARSKAPADGEVFPNAVLQALYALWQQPQLIDTLTLRPLSWQQALLLLRHHWRYHLEVTGKAWRVWQQLSAPTQPLRVRRG